MSARLLLGLLCLAIVASVADASVLDFHSGNGNPRIVGGPDALIRFKPWRNAAVPNTPTSQDFADVRTLDPVAPVSYSATIAATDTNGWEPLPEDPEALPVFNFLASGRPDFGSSALFGIPIDMQESGGINQLTLEFTYIVDNYLGYDDGNVVVEGLYFGSPGNEIALEDTANCTEYDPMDPQNTRFLSGSHRIDVTDAYTGKDVYWLYMNVTDRGVSAAGILFTGRLTVPEPATATVWSLLALFACGITYWRKRRI